MTESEWLASSDPAAMLFLFQPRLFQAEGTGSHEGPARFPVSDRKLRLFACACCRQVWHLLADERSRRAVELAERFADGEVGTAQLSGARSVAASARNWKGESLRDYPAWLAHVCTAEEIVSIIGVVVRQAELPHLVPAAGQATLLREIIGNPFRPVTLLRKIKVAEGMRHAPEISSTAMTGWAEYEEQLVAWLTPTVRQLAHAIYADRRFEDLPILADALEEAGCEDGAVLRHCRRPSLCVWCKGSRKIRQPIKMGGPEQGPEIRYIIEPPSDTEVACPFCQDGECGPHVRGCWVLDLVLGKE